ncbi:hypothetical protein Dda_4720 [Drechslerella dactyloides]|uniref:Uncharacterized protein n=1 Tax=Drechslerella dactyloides TaxID=74499 RepID=A0AAD6IYU7_DREDA|nr:hypothetical protein Dda_4720 [Drechslerella dactyloides]
MLLEGWREFLEAVDRWLQEGGDGDVEEEWTVASSWQAEGEEGKKKEEEKEKRQMEGETEEGRAGSSKLIAPVCPPSSPHWLDPWTTRSLHRTPAAARIDGKDEEHRDLDSCSVLK